MVHMCHPEALQLTQERSPSHTDVDSSTPLLNPTRGDQALEESSQPQQLNDMEWEEVMQHHHLVTHNPGPQP
jgi:hypothetical protein